MAPLIVLLSATLLVRAVGAAGVRQLANWHAALRGGLVAMFTVTGVSHFVGMRSTMIAMVPPLLPRPELLVTSTGILELSGAAGLLSKRTTPWAARGLGALLVVMFPANIYAALHGTTVNETPAMKLGPRALLQATYLTAIVTVAMHRRPTPPARSTDVSS